jgi:hypothetical protein
MKRIVPFVLFACNDVGSFTTTNDHYEGAIVQAPFVRAGMGGDVRMCLAFDGENFQTTPGSISTNDGRFRNAALRPIPQEWHDSISLLSFGDGRARSMIYAAAPIGEPDVLAVLSLMRDGSVEVRLLRSAPGRTDAPMGDSPVFGIFQLKRTPGSCPF